MAIAVDDTVASWTSEITSGNSITSGSFTPANDSLLVVEFVADGDVGEDINCVVTGGSLTWTQRAERDSADASSQEGHASIHTAPVSTGASMTIACTISGNAGIRRCGAKVYIVTGQHASPIGTTGEGSSTTNNITPTLFTSTGAGRAFYVGSEWNALGAATSTDTETALTDTTPSGSTGTTLCGLFVYKASDHAASASVAGSLDASGAGAAAWNWCALEVLAAAEAGGGFRSRIAGGFIVSSM